MRSEASDARGRTDRKELFTIGEIGKLFHVSIRTLRYYDAAGLLKPETTDPVTGYRYYSTRQFERLNTIKYLRALDMPIERIIRFFENKDTDTLMELLKEQQRETQLQRERLERISKKLDRRIHQLADALDSRLDEMDIVHLPRRRIAFLRGDISLEEDLEYPIRELERRNDLGAVMFLGKVGVSVSREQLLRRQFDGFSEIFVVLEQEDGMAGDTWRRGSMRGCAIPAPTGRPAPTTKSSWITWRERGTPAGETLWRSPSSTPASPTTQKNTSRNCRFL